MRAVIQRVAHCKVEIDREAPSSISKGLLILLGIEVNDTAGDVEWLCGKIAQMRIFNDEKGVMNLSVKDINGEVMAVSQFTLHASTRKGNRPSYIRAAKPDLAIPLYEMFVKQMEAVLQKKIATGRFGANMQVTLCNDGPVTIIIDTKNKEE